MEFLCLDFVNSSWYITHKLFSDPLKNHKWLLQLAANWNIKPLPAPDKKDMESLIEMRNFFSKLLFNICKGGKLSKAEAELVNSYMTGACFRRQLQEENGSLRLQDVPESQDYIWFKAEVAASFSRLYTSEALKSLRMCQNPECRWFFIDESKLGNRKWCNDTCATLMKVRRFRRKQKSKEKTSP